MKSHIKIGIVYQGELGKHYNLPVINQWNGTMRDDVVFSSWDYERENTEKKFNIKAIYNIPPSKPGPSNFNFQVKSTLAGIEYFKNRNFTHVIKVRSDITIDNIDLLLNVLINNIDTENPKIWFSAYNNHLEGYLCEHFVFGDINDMQELWKIEEKENGDRYPEYHLTKSYLEKIKKPVNYLFPLIFRHNIKCFWNKYNYYLNDVDTKSTNYIRNDFSYDKYI